MQFPGGSGGYGLNSRVSGFMDANSNQGARAVYMNSLGQTVRPTTGKAVSIAILMRTIISNKGRWM